VTDDNSKGVEATADEGECHYVCAGEMWHIIVHVHLSVVENLRSDSSPHPDLPFSSSSSKFKPPPLNGKVQETPSFPTDPISDPCKRCKREMTSERILWLV
jgi:hypothetical protein